MAYIQRVQMLEAWYSCRGNDKRERERERFYVCSISLKYILTCNGLNPQMQNPTTTEVEIL